MDEREEELRQQWADHRQRFKSGAKRSSLRGVIKSSYLKELRDDGRGNHPAGGEGGAGGSHDADGSSLSYAPRRSTTEGRGFPSPASGDNINEEDDDSSWENVPAGSGPSSDAASTVAGAAANAAVAASAISGASVVAPPRPPPPRETVHVLTTPGPTRVTIVGHRGRATNGGDGAPLGSANSGGNGGARWLSVVTLHAAGHNHRTCLGALEREVAKDDELGGVVFYHVDTPGHEEEAEDVE